MGLCAAGRSRTTRQKHYRPKDTRAAGKLEEDRFFLIIGANRARLPDEVERIERASTQLDRFGADGKIIFTDGTRCYFDVKSTVGAMEDHGRLGSLVPAFLILSTERDRMVMDNFAAFIGKQRSIIASHSRGRPMIAPAERHMAAAPA